MKLKKDKTDLHQENLQQLGQRLRKIRQSLNLKQKEFAAELDISKSYYSQIENGHSNPCFDFFQKLLERYQVSFDYLFYGIGNIFLKSDQDFPLDRESLVKIESKEDLLWYIENSTIFLHSIMDAGNAILEESKRIIRLNLQRALQAKQEEKSKKD